MSSNLTEQANSENEKLCLSSSTNIDNCKLALKEVVNIITGTMIIVNQISNSDLNNEAEDSRKGTVRKELTNWVKIAEIIKFRRTQIS